MPKWEVAARAAADLGECPVWDGDESCVWFVDINRGRVNRLHTVTGEVTDMVVSQPVSAAIPRRDGGLILGMPDGFHFARWGSASTQRVVACAGAHDPIMRVNDAKCDPRGVLWAGIIATDHRPGVSTLCRLGPSGAVPMVTGCDLANGIGWSPGADLMYLVDSLARTISVFDYDIGAAELSQRRVWLAIPQEHGVADGIAVDAEGGVWVAMARASSVHRYDDRGVLTEVIDLPASKITSVCFGGPDLADLYVTSARFGLSDEELAAQPHAGDVFVVTGAGQGQPTFKFDAASIAADGST